MDQRESYQTLLPATTTPLQNSPLLSETTLKRKRAHTTKVACNSCRQKKSACDGERPKCRHCLDRNFDCVYITAHKSETSTMALKRENDALRKRSATLDDLVNHLRYLPEHTAQAMLQQLRTTSDISSVLQHFRDNTLTDRPSEQVAVGILPPPYSQLELELMAAYPEAYPTLDSEDNRLSGSPKLRPLKTPRLNQGAFSELSAQSPFPRMDCSPVSSEFPAVLSSSNAPMEVFHVATQDAATRAFGVCPLADPEVLAEHYDPRLAHLSISNQTAVPIMDYYAAAVDALSLQEFDPLLKERNEKLHV